MRKIILTFLLVAVTCSAMSQNLTTTYFLDHDNTRFRINPAFVPEDTIRWMLGAAVSNIAITPQSNIGLSSFIFPVDGELVTGLNSKVPAEEFLGGLNEQNLFNVGATVNLVTVGFRPDPKGFATIEINTRTNTFSDLPKSLFSFLKLGSSKNAFDIKNFNTSSSNYLELALGYSRKIGDNLSVGGRVKILGGLGRADMLVDQVSLQIDSQTKLMQIESSGTMSIYCPGIEMDTKVNADGTVVYDLPSIRIGDYKLAGFGLGFDLGINWRPLDGLEVDAAIQDAGFLVWSNSVNGVMAKSTQAYFTSAEIKEAVNSILNFVPEDPEGTTAMSIPMTARLGARYAMPFYDRLSFGILETLETGGKYFTYNDLRIGATVTPIDQISVAVNYGITSFGSAMGLACNFNLGPVQLFLGTDALIFEFTPQGVPISKLNTTVSGGLMFQFKKHSKK